MVSRVSTVSFLGVDTKHVDVQIHMAQGLPSFNIVGLPDKAVAESKERIRAAFHSIGMALPAKRITVNLAPADLTKVGSHFDLPIAVGLLAELEIISHEEIEGYIVIGELALDGEIRSVHGSLPAAMSALAQNKGLICPYANGSEALWSGNADILAPKGLIDLVNHLCGKQQLGAPEQKASNTDLIYPDLKDIKGQKLAKRALEIAAAGGHNLLMIGPPGSGKSMLAKRMPGLIPPLTPEEMLEVNIIASVAGEVDTNRGIIGQRPYRDPHCSASMAAMVGGGKNAKPGEVTLSHLGVLFLDELPEFSRNVLESLRQPIESGTVTIARADFHVTYPSKFQLIAAMNPCKCGYYGDLDSSCSKAPRCVEDYQSKISGPLFDRFDLRIDVPAINAMDIEEDEHAEKSADVRNRVAHAREIQAARYKKYDFKLNNYADGEILNDLIPLNKECKSFLKSSIDKFSLSMRGFTRVLRVARTIADLAGNDNVEQPHIAEALSYRISKFKV